MKSVENIVNSNVILWKFELAMRMLELLVQSNFSPDYYFCQGLADWFSLLLFFAVYVIYKKNYSFSRVVFLFFSDINCQLFLFKNKWQRYA